MGLIGENGETYGDRNLVVEEALRVTYSQMIVNGSWGWVSGNMSGSYTQMREFHRYATKSFRYVGMTYEVAKTCRDDMIAKFSRVTFTSVWDANRVDGAWLSQENGYMPMADVSLVHDEGDAWSVHVRVNEDSVRYRHTGYNYDSYALYKLFFGDETSWGYGSDGEGTADETEPVNASETA